MFRRFDRAGESQEAQPDQEDPRPVHSGQSRELERESLSRMLIM